MLCSRRGVPKSTANASSQAMWTPSSCEQTVWMRGRSLYAARDASTSPRQRLTATYNLGTSLRTTTSILRATVLRCTFSQRAALRSRTAQSESDPTGRARGRGGNAHRVGSATPRRAPMNTRRSSPAVKRVMIEPMSATKQISRTESLLASTCAGELSSTWR